MSRAKELRYPCISYTISRRSPNGIKVVEWDSLSECAKSFGIQVNKVKEHVYEGSTHSDGKTTFEVPTWADYDIGKRVFRNQVGKVRVAYYIIKRPHCRCDA